MTLGHKLRLLREANLLTQKQMAAKVPIGTSGYGKIERGETIETIERINQFSAIFNVDPKILTTEEGIVIIVSDTGSVTAFLASEFNHRQAANLLEALIPHIKTCIKEELPEVFRTIVNEKLKACWWVLVNATYTATQLSAEELLPAIAA